MKISVSECHPIGLYQYINKKYSIIILSDSVNGHELNSIPPYNNYASFDIGSNGFLSYEDDKWFVTNLWVLHRIDILFTYYSFEQNKVVTPQLITNVSYSNCVKLE